MNYLLVTNKFKWDVSNMEDCGQRGFDQLRSKIAHQKVVFGVFKYHVDGLVFQHDLSKLDDINVLNLPV